MLQITDLTHRIAGRKLFDQATVAVPAGHRVGLVGRNGSGKTTLLRMITGELHPDEGQIAMPLRWRVGTVAQEAPSGATSLLDTVLAADTERAALLDEAETVTDPHRIAEVHTRLAEIAAHAAPARAASILAGLGFDDAVQAGPCSALSGGMRMRVALAQVLFRQPDLLLLDEPTNHLDLEATLWLEGYLQRYPHTILLVSHDRDLLNRAVGSIVHLNAGKLEMYAGGYDRFETTRRLKLEHQAALQARQEAQRRHMQAFVDRFRYKASKARQAQSRLKALERMEPIAAVAEEPTIAFAFPEPEALAPPILTLERAAAGYDGRTVLRNLSLRIDMDDRLALLGANGNGKSTLVKLLGGRLDAMDGEVQRAPKLRIGYFAQHQADELDLGATALRQAMDVMPKATEEKVRSHLGRFGFPQARAETRIGDMSGGEKARLLLALMARDAPHLLLLDEPTNHLDVDSRQALIQAINDYPGAVILISHDPHLIELTADRLLLVADGTCRPYDGDLADYRKWLLSRGGNQDGRADGARTQGSIRKQERRTAAEARAALAPLRRQATDAEKRIAALEREKAELERQLADPALYGGASERVTDLQKRLHAVGRGIEEAETAWLEAQAALEDASASGTSG
ncbi:MAG: ABC-F family ATP-binding cassette domain-containing protein [Rhodospirillaceae bacterium]|nr:ABC-F family ATP-binding cassette domain-containing protein [Rhodospirillaceae bacterium]